MVDHNNNDFDDDDDPIAVEWNVPVAPGPRDRCARVFDQSAFTILLPLRLLLLLRSISIIITIIISTWARHGDEWRTLRPTCHGRGNRTLPLHYTIPVRLKVFLYPHGSTLLVRCSCSGVHYVSILSLSIDLSLSLFL